MTGAIGGSDDATAGAEPAVHAPAPGVADASDAAVRSQDGLFGVPIQDQPEADATVTRIELHDDGSATWMIQVRTRLASGDEVDSYRAFQEQFRTNRSQYRASFRERMTGVVESADESTGRSMTASNFSAATRIESAPQRWGVVAYRFRWDGFAAGGDGRLTVGDVFAGNFFIEENSVLEIVVPEDYRVTTVTPAPDRRSDGTLEWEGPTTFGDRQPRVEATTSGSQGSFPILPAAGLAIVVLALAGLALARRRGAFERILDESASGGAASPSPQPGPVTDEGRVHDLLEARDGRCKQSEVADELDWSTSKTSRVLSRMAEEDRIEKLRIGRENVIELPDED